MGSVVIAGTGSYLPEPVLTNADLERVVDTSDEWIRTRTGIRERRICPREWAASDLGWRACARAMEDAGCAGSEVDAIICTTITGDRVFPSTACMIQRKLGLDGIPCFDISAACSGFIYGLEIARSLVASHTYGTVLVVACECMSRLVDYADRATCVLLGDGAGAAVVRYSDREGAGVLGSYLASSGKYGDLLHVPAGGSLMPASSETVEKRLHFMKMEGSALFRVAVAGMTEAVEKILERFHVHTRDVSVVIPHQANLRIISAVARNLSLPLERFYVNIQTCGNMSAASVAVALDESLRAGRAHKGELLVTASFGAGLTWASNLIRWER